MALSRRGLLGGMLVALAAPAIIRTPGILMPIKPPLRWAGIRSWWATPESATDGTVLFERYSLAWEDWHGAWRVESGDMTGFDLSAPDSVPVAMEKMKKLRQMETDIAEFQRLAHGTFT